MASLLNVGRGLIEKLPYDYKVDYVSNFNNPISLPFKISADFTIRAKVYIHKTETKTFSLYTETNTPWSEQLTTRILQRDNASILYFQLFGNDVGSQGRINSFLYNNAVEVEIGNYYVKNLNTSEYYFNKDRRTTVTAGNNTIRACIMGAHRLYYATYIINNVVVCDLIPVVHNSLGYVYDKVSRQLLGEGTSVFGPRVS